MAFKREGTHPLFYTFFFFHIHFMSWTSRFHGFGGSDVVPTRTWDFSFLVFLFFFFVPNNHTPGITRNSLLVDRAKVVMRRA